MAKKLKQIKLPLYNGAQTMQKFLQKNKGLFNCSELDRLSKQPEGTFRYITKGKGARKMTDGIYIKLRKALTVKIAELNTILKENE